MTRGEFLVEVRSLASTASTPETLEHAVAVLVGLAVPAQPEGAVVRKALAGLAYFDFAPEFNQEELDALGPLAVGALDRVIVEIMTQRCSSERLREMLGAPVTEGMH
jgi:hypothetical protein